MTTIKTTTAQGQAVEVSPYVIDAATNPIPGALIAFTHPEHGACLVAADSYIYEAQKKGAWGEVFLGVSGNIDEANFSYKSKINRGRVLIEAEIYNAAADAAELMMDDLETDEDEMSFAAAKAVCPVGFVPCILLWQNGDLCAAKYEAEDGTKVLSHDLLESHQGYYWIRQPEVDAARTKNTHADESAEKAAQAQDAQIKAATMEASKTGQAVIVQQWTEDCDGTVSECSRDLCYRVVNPDGSTEIKRSHSH